MNEHDLDRLLRQALSPAQVPSPELNKKTMERMKESDHMKPSNHKRILSVALAAALILTLSLTAFASWHFLSTREAAEKAGNPAIAAAFGSEGAVAVNQSVDSGDYHFTLHGVVTGKNLTGFTGSDENIRPDRTYAVLSIAKRDGAPMPGPQDSAYGDPPFFVSPLVKGQKPWQVNIASMNGGYGEIVEGGVLYRLIECDGIEMFADRGLYLCASATPFFDNNAFDYDETTGEVRANPAFDGACALFDLPLDPSKADHARADAYLDALLNPQEEPGDSSGTPEVDMDELKEAVANGTVLPGSEKEITYDKYGMACYKFDGIIEEFLPEAIFTEGQTGPSDSMSISEDSSGNRVVIQYSRDETGVITGKAVRIEE